VAGRAGPARRPLRSLDLDLRIDYAFVTTRKKDGRGTIHDCRVVLPEREGLGEVAICASDPDGVCAGVQIAAVPRIAAALRDAAQRHGPGGAPVAQTCRA
jgi:hypothetical protein